MREWFKFHSERENIDFWAKYFGSEEAFRKKVEEIEQKFQNFLKTAEGKKWQMEKYLNEQKNKPEKPYRRVIHNYNNSGRTKIEYLRRQKR